MDGTCILEHRRDPDRPRRVSPGLLVCGGHRTGVARSLLELPGMHERLVAAHAGAGHQSEIRTGGHAGLTLNDRVANARGNIRTSLTTWCRHAAAERAWTLPTDTIGAMAGYLLGRRGATLDWCLARAWADEFVDDIDTVHRAAFGLLYPRGDRHVPVAACRQPLWSDVPTRSTFYCGGILVVTFRGSDRDRFPDAICDDCGREVPPVDWQRLVDRDVRLTAVELAELWTIPVRTVSRWADSDGWPSDGGRPARYSLSVAELTRLRMRPEPVSA